MNAPITDTHTHLFLPQFDEDRDQVMQRAQEWGVRYCFLPNIDKDTITATWQMTHDYPDTCYAMMGLHPCSVGEDYTTHLSAIEQELHSNKPVYAVGETGLDFYWDDTYQAPQEESFRQHLRWAKQLGLPVSIHVRNSFERVATMLEEENDPSLFGIVHCFTGAVEQGYRILKLGGFYLGIGGIVTFKNAGLAEVVAELPLDSLLLETDAPYLAPHPYRGKRNETAYTRLVGEKMAEMHHTSLEEVARQTTANAGTIFQATLTGAAE
jgi:TatD DNase family protein